MRRAAAVLTQDPVLRAKFAGEPEHAINFFFMVAENMREHMAAMGFRNVDDMIGRADMLEVNQEVIRKYPRLAGINLDKILLPAAKLRQNVAQRCVRKQVRGPACTPALPLLAGCHTFSYIRGCSGHQGRPCHCRLSLSSAQCRTAFLVQCHCVLLLVISLSCQSSA